MSPRSHDEPTKEPVEVDALTANSNANTAKTLAIVALVLILGLGAGLGLLYKQEHQARLDAEKTVAAQQVASSSAISTGVGRQIQDERVRVDSLQLEVNAYKKQLAAVNARLADIAAAQQPELAASVADLQTQYASLQAIITTDVSRQIASQVGPLETRVNSLDSLRAETTSLTTRVNGVDQRLTVLNNRGLSGKTKFVIAAEGVATIIALVKR